MNFVFKYIAIFILIIGAWLGFYCYKKSSYHFVQEKVNVSLDLLKDKKNIAPIVIIGSGCAGLSAAVYGARSSLYTIVLEGKEPGGQLTTTSYVENWPGSPKALGSHLINQLKKQAEQFGAVIVNDTAEKVDFSSWPFKIWTTDGNEINALSVIIATGSTPKTLKVPGEKEYWGKGVTTCAVCDAPYFKNKKVVIVGGGDSAVEEATLLSSFAKEVTMLVRGGAMRAAPSMQQRVAQNSQIKVMYNSSISAILGNKDHVNAIEIINTKDKSKTKVDMDGVFLAIGHDPNSTLFKKYLKLDERGYISLAPRTQQTTLQGVFSAGDVSDPEFKQAGVAAGDGIKAALGAVSFLKEHGFTDAFARNIEKNYFELESEKATVEPKVAKNLKEFENILKSNKYVVLDFYAPWCPSCMHMLPVLSSVAAKFGSKVAFVKVNTGDVEDIPAKYNVTSVPWLLVFKDGKEIVRTKDIMTKRQMYTYLSQYIS